VATTPSLPSLNLVADQAATERETLRGHAESLDAKAGVVLGFSGVLVALGATAQVVISENWYFRVGLMLGVAAAGLSAWALQPRKYPVVELGRLRDKYLTAPEDETRLQLLDAQIDMVVQVTKLLEAKGRKLSAAVGCLAVATGLVVVGTLTAGGNADVRRPAEQPACHHDCRTSHGTATSAAAVQAG
jgi:hypothetical protein